MSDDRLIELACVVAGIALFTYAFATGGRGLNARLPYTILMLIGGVGLMMFGTLYFIIRLFTRA